MKFSESGNSLLRLIQLETAEKMDDKFLKDLWTVLKQALLEKIELGETEVLVGHAEDRSVQHKISEGTCYQIIIDNPIKEMFKEWEYPYGDNKFQNPDPVFTISGKIANGFTVATPFAVKIDRSEGKLSISFYPITVVYTNKGRHTK